MFQIICPTLFMSIAYWMSGQPREWDRFFMLWLANILLAFLGQSFGNAMGAGFESQVTIFFLIFYSFINIFFFSPCLDGTVTPLLVRVSLTLSLPLHPIVNGKNCINTRLRLLKRYHYR